MPRCAATELNAAAVGGGKTLRERILLLQEDYLGSVRKVTRKLWVLKPGLVPRMVTYVPGLLRIFDEILVYAADNKQRDPAMDHLRVEVDAARCTISVYYNGKGVPIDQLKGLYAPERIFGHLGDSDQEEISGVKLTNIFSTEFIIESAHSNIEKKYRQVFSENMGKKSEPQVTICLQGIDWTKITFKPDLEKFNLTCLDDDFISLASKRALDMAAILGPTVQVVFNGSRLPQFRSFKEYVFAYLKTARKDRGREFPSAHGRINGRWEVCVTQSEGTFEQVSFVNKFATIEGGTHVDLVANHIAARVVELCKNIFNVEEHQVKRHLWVFVNATVEKQMFNSPTKEALTTPEAELGLDCELPAAFLQQVFCFTGAILSPWNRCNVPRKSSKRRNS